MQQPNYQEMSDVMKDLLELYEADERETGKPNPIHNLARLLVEDHLEMVESNRQGRVSVRIVKPPRHD